MAPAGSVGAASVPSACQMVLSSEYASTEPARSAFAYVRPVGAVAAVCEPPALVAVTTSETVAPMSPGVSEYVDWVAPGIAAHDAPLGSQRRHWYTNAVGEPVHVPTDELSCCPATVVPAML